MKRLFIYFSILFLFTSCENILVPENNTNKNIEDFESAWKIVNDVYPFFELKKIDWDSVHSIYKSKAVQSNGDEIYKVLFDMLTILKDGHVGLKTKGGDYIKTFTPPRVKKDKNSYSPYVVRRYFSKELRLDTNGRLEYEITRSNIGYMRISTFTMDEWKKSDFYNALDYLKNTKGLILDVRNNSGGSSNMYAIVIQRIISSSIRNLPVKIKGHWNQESFIYPKGKYQYVKPIVILMNGVSFSATEGFLATVQQIPHVTLFGDTSAGASGAPEYFTLPSGKSIRVSTKQICRLDSIAIEWNGIPPDIRIEQTEFDIKQNKDKQLEYALDYLNR